MTISLQQLKYFIEVAKIGSINQAAEFSILHSLVCQSQSKTLK